jgi:aspartate kinase
MEQPIISGVAHDRSEAKITVVGVPDNPRGGGKIFTRSPTPASTST